ncbi:hypothetical protein T01_5828 [Trichinella spiralis]|uniref:Uncharacterized protein n=1 Tax=Trichinella spiralis TaxID=6334 RepID=A0A0V1AY87_TRISP|nr:hypothetical protein T01_5828 [Trichinella spiralis]
MYILGSTGLRSNQLVYCSAKSFINYCSERNSADCGGLCIATGVAGVSVIKEAAHLAEKVYGASAACSFYIYKPAEHSLRCRIHIRALFVNADGVRFSGLLMESGRKIAKSLRLGLSTISDICRDTGKNSCEELSFQKLKEAIWCHNLRAKICKIAAGLFLLGPTFFLLVFAHAILLDRQIFVVLENNNTDERSESSEVKTLINKATVLSVNLYPQTIICNFEIALIPLC